MRPKGGACRQATLAVMPSGELRLTGKSILVVDDEALILCLLEDSLTDAGFDVETVASGDEAIARLNISVDNVAGIVTDIRVSSEASGWEVARHARVLKSTIPIVYMSGDSASDWAANGVPNSVMIQKPFAAAQVITAIATLINDTPPAQCD